MRASGLRERHARNPEQEKSDEQRRYETQVPEVLSDGQQGYS